MYIRKILPYDVYAGTTSSDRYKRVCNLLNQEIDPETLQPDAMECEEKHILVSSRKRAISCIRKDSTSSISIAPELNEIAFSLQEFCSKENFLKYGSTSVRAAFVQAFIENKLNIPHEQLRAELSSILETSKQAEPPLCISHTFRMKLIEIYNNVGDELFGSPKIIQVHIDTKKHFYNFSEIIEI